MCVCVCVQVLGGLAYGLEGDSSWYVMFTLFSTYTMLPLPLLWALGAGTLTSVLDLAVEAFHLNNGQALRTVGVCEGVCVCVCVCVCMYAFLPQPLQLWAGPCVCVCVCVCVCTSACCPAVSCLLHSWHLRQRG